MRTDLSEEEIRATLKDVFSSDYYLSQYLDIEGAGMDPLFHYIRHGWMEGRNPSAAFDTNYYLESNKDVALSCINPFYQFITEGLEQGRRPVPLPCIYADEQQYQFVRDIVGKEFNLAYYTATCPGFKQQMRDPLDHFLLLGWESGCDPAPEFSVSYYLESNEDVRKTGINPFYHYIVLGRLEGRLAKPDDEPASARIITEKERQAVAEVFDEVFYLNRYRDIREGGINPFEHFLEFGWKEGRDPSASFSTKYYLYSNPDVQLCGMNPLYHYVISGKHEGRLPRLPGGHISLALRDLESLEQKVAAWLKPPDEQLVIRSAQSLQARLLQFVADRLPCLVVSLSHDDYTVSVGGVQYCILLEQQAVLNSGAIYLNFNPVQPLPVLSGELDLDKLLLNIVCNGEHIGVSSAADCLAVLVQLKAHVGQVDLVVHALFGHAPGFVTELARRVVSGQSIYWVHDYLSVCPGYNLLRNGVKYCGAPAPDSMACSICVYGEERRRQHAIFQDLFNSVSFTVVAPSEIAAEIWMQHARLKHKELVVQPHTQFVKQSGSEQRNLEAVDKGGRPVLRVAFLGHPEYHKGWPVFVELVRKNEKNPAFEFHHFSQKPCEEVNVLHTPVKVSNLHPNAMTDALSGKHIDLAFIWSVWPETYCLTAYEAVAAGALLLTNRDSGNVARLVDDESCGFILDSSKDVINAFTSCEIFGLVESAREQKFRKPILLTYSDMSADLLQFEQG